MTDNPTPAARRVSGDDAIEAADVRAGSTRQLNIADVTPMPVPADTANLRLGPDLHHDCLSLLPLVGVWRGTGTYGNDARDAGSPAADFGQQITVSHDGRPFLKFESVSWNLTSEHQPSDPGRSEDSGSADSRSEDLGSADSRSKTAGSETPGSEAAGSETAGSETAGSETAGSETAGSAGADDAGAGSAGAGFEAAGPEGAGQEGGATPRSTPGAREIGWLRPQPDGAIELLLAHAEGRIEVFYGRPRSVASWALSTDSVWRTPTAVPVIGATRLYGITPDGRLAYVEERAHTDAELAPHASALLTRLTG